MPISAELEKEYKECFDLFDKNANGTISSAEIGTVIRSLGSNPTEEDLGKLVADINAKGGTVNFQGFLAIMESRKGDVDSQLEVQEALKIFDKEGQGLLPVVELKHILTNIGERMTDEEVDEMLRDATIDAEGQVKIAELVKLMFA